MKPRLLEQLTLPGMPAPALPAGPRRSDNDDSAEAVARMGLEPDAPAADGELFP